MIHHLGSITSTDGRVDRSAISSRNRDLFRKKFYAELQDITREINLIIFPDWRQDIHLLYQELGKAIVNLATYPDRTRITLLIATSHITQEDANLILSDVMMSLLLQDNLEVTDELEITLLQTLEEMQWERLLPYIHWRIALNNENTQATIAVTADTIPSCKLDDLSRMRAVQLGENHWEFK